MSKYCELGIQTSTRSGVDDPSRTVQRFLNILTNSHRNQQWEGIQLDRNDKDWGRIKLQLMKMSIELHQVHQSKHRWYKLDNIIIKNSYYISHILNNTTYYNFLTTFSFHTNHSLIHISFKFDKIAFELENPEISIQSHIDIFLLVFFCLRSFWMFMFFVLGSSVLRRSLFNTSFVSKGRVTTLSTYLLEFFRI